MNKIVFGYVRVSGASQIEKDGPTRQREAIAKFCEMNNITGPDFTHSDLGVSGTIEGLNRPGFVSLLTEAEELIATGREVAIVVEKLDRFARDLIVSELLMRELRSRNVALYATDQGPVDLTTADADPSRKLIRQIFAAMAEYEKSALVVKLKVARERVIKEKGKCGGNRAFGCDSATTSANSERIILNLIRDLREANNSWPSIATMFNASGVKNRKGKTGTWDESLVRKIWKNHLKRQNKNMPTKR